MLLTRRIVGLACALLLLAGCGPTAPPAGQPPASTTNPAKADAVMTIVRDTMAEAHLKAVIVPVTIDGKEVVTRAVGDSMAGVPATTNMLPQRRGRDLLRLDPAADPRRRKTGRP